MNQNLIDQAAQLHEAARLLFLSYCDTLPPRVRNGIENCHLPLSVKVVAGVTGARIDFTKEAPGGARHVFGSIAIPDRAHDHTCACPERLDRAEFAAPSANPPDGSR